ncbi:MAG: hypothetical protein RLZZ484_1178 [Pseudomonadota bacterium]
MKVLDLQCTHSHAFEGWFASEEDFQGQLSRGLVECPLCGDRDITKKLSAPRLNLATLRGDKPIEPATLAPAAAESNAPSSQEVASLAPQQLQAAWLQMVQHVMANTEDVGEKFADEARKIHYGESQERNIRGQASREETEALQEEGIAVMPLPIPAALKGPVQ